MPSSLVTELWLAQGWLMPWRTRKTNQPDCFVQTRDLVELLDSPGSCLIEVHELRHLCMQAGEQALTDRNAGECRMLLALKVLLAEGMVRIQLTQHALSDAPAALTDLQRLLVSFPSSLQSFLPSQSMLLGEYLGLQDSGSNFPYSRHIHTYIL